MRLKETQGAIVEGRGADTVSVMEIEGSDTETGKSDTGVIGDTTGAVGDIEESGKQNCWTGDGSKETWISWIGVSYSSHVESGGIKGGEEGETEEMEIEFHQKLHAWKYQ